MALVNLVGRSAAVGLLSVGLLMNVACKGEETDTETDTNTPPPPPPSFFAPELAGFNSVFGYDAATDTARSVTFTDGVQDPFLEIAVYSEAFETTEDEELDACYVFVQAAGPLPLASWGTDVGAYFAFDFPTTAPFQSNCNDADHELDPEIWDSSFAATLAGHGWGISVGPLDSDLRTEFQNQVGADWATEYAPYVHGGGVRVPRFANEPDLPQGFFDINFGYAFAVDESFAPLPGDDGTGVALFVPGSAENEATTIGTGMYQMRGAYVLLVEYLVP